jgi:hypothetical protein
MLMLSMRCGFRPLYPKMTELNDLDYGAWQRETHEEVAKEWSGRSHPGPRMARSGVWIASRSVTTGVETMFASLFRRRAWTTAAQPGRRRRTAEIVARIQLNLGLSLMKSFDRSPKRRAPEVASGPFLGLQEADRRLPLACGAAAS